MQELYQYFHERAMLTDSHRQALRNNRGFSDYSIDTFRFISGRPENKAILEEMKGKWSDDELVAAGLYKRSKDSGAIWPNKQLLDDRVIIPYLDEDGKTVTLLRPHKDMLGGVPLQAYCRYLLRNKPQEIVITEGEFKAAALAVWGVPAIGIPGVSSFAGKHYEQLLNLLREYEVRKVIIAFDNEVKNDPKFGNYKAKPEDRWDTPYWAYLMAYKLGREDGLEALIATIPDDWRVNGKGDWDGALSQHRTKYQVDAVLRQAVPSAEYLDTLSGEAQRVVRRKVSVYFLKSPVERSFNKYVATRKKGEHEFRQPISNFVLDIRATYYSAEGAIRQVQFTNEYGEKSELFHLDPKGMARPAEFKQFCFGKGNYVWQGTSDDLDEVWRYELAHDTGDVIQMPEQIGEIRPGFWLWGNMAIWQGKVYRPDDEGIVWIDGMGFKSQGLSSGPRGESLAGSIPVLYEGDVDIKEIANVLRKSVGGYQAYIGIGWIIASIFSSAIFKQYKCFPFIFAHGKREAGKSTFMRWLMAFFGTESEGVSIAESTQNYIMRALSYFSSLPIWFDEYRNEPRVTSKDGYLRSAYNRQMSGKGTKEGFGAKGYTVRGIVAISGEELPRDNGLFTRCIPLQISANRREREHYEWLAKHQTRFSGFIYWLILHYEELKPKILTAIAELKGELVSQNISDRTAENWAIVAGAYHAVMEPLAKSPEEHCDLVGFLKWVLTECQVVRQNAEDEHMLNVFWADIVMLLSETVLNLEHFRVVNDKLFIWYSTVYLKWAEYYKRRTGREPFDKTSILRYLMEEQSFEANNKKMRIWKMPRACVVMTRQKASQQLEEVFCQVEEMERLAKSAGKYADDDEVVTEPVTSVTS